MNSVNSCICHSAYIIHALLRRVHALLLLPLLLTAIWRAPASGQCFRFETPIDCGNRLDNEQDFQKSYMRGVQAKVEMNQEIADARAKFWATYPNRPGAAEAGQKFAELLYQKDIYYLIVNQYAQSPELTAKRGPDFIANHMDTYVGGIQVDDGIPKAAKPEFLEWAKAFKENLAAAGGVISPNAVDNAFKAMAASETEHHAYLIARDWAEFDAAGRVPAGFDQPEAYAALLYLRFGKTSLSDAHENVRVMRKMFGDEVVLRAAKEVLNAPKTRDGNLVTHVNEVPMIKDSAGREVPDDSVPAPTTIIGSFAGPLSAFEALCTRTDDRRYAIDLLADMKPTRGGQSRHIGKWAFGQQAYSHFVDSYRESSVLEASHAVRTATKRLDDSYVMNPKGIGAEHYQPYRAFQDVLARNDPAGSVKLILAFDPGINSREEVNAAYQKLVSTYKEPAIFAAMKKIAATNPDPMYGELDLLTEELEGKPHEPGPSVARGGKGGSVGGRASPRVDIPATQTVPPQPYVPNPELPHYELTEQNAASSVSSYCHDMYNPPQPLLSPDQIKLYYANPGAIDADVNRCISLFDVKQVMANRKLAMRYCIVTHDPSQRNGAEQKSYDDCMNQNDIITALCTLETNNRAELNRKKGFETMDAQCPGAIPHGRIEYSVVKFGGSEDLGHFVVPSSGPGVPSILHSGLPAGVLHTPQSASAAARNSTNPASQATSTPPARSPSAHSGPSIDYSTSGSTASRPAPASHRMPSFPGMPGANRNIPTSSPSAVQGQVELARRYKSAADRASRARSALAQLQRTQTGAAADLPDFVREARARLDAQLRAAGTAITSPDSGAAEQSFQELEDTLTVIETFLSDKPGS